MHNRLMSHCFPLLDAPRFSDMSGYREPVFGQHFQMECPLEGSPPTIYYWQKYESIDMATETNFTTDVQFVDGGRIWYVDVVTAKLSGMYVCRAENEKGTEVYVDVMNFFLSVSGKHSTVFSQIQNGCMVYLLPTAT